MSIFNIFRSKPSTLAIGIMRDIEENPQDYKYDQLNRKWENDKHGCRIETLLHPHVYIPGLWISHSGSSAIIEFAIKTLPIDQTPRGSKYYMLKGMEHNKNSAQ